jgi:hypothetical protein
MESGKTRPSTLSGVPLAHVGHWIWDLLIIAPFLALAAALFIADILHRRDPERFEREGAEEETAAERELDEIVSG